MLPRIAPLFLLAVVGCQSVPDFDRTRTFPAPVETVWEATRQAIHDEYLSVERADPKAMVMTTERDQSLSGMRAIDAVFQRPYVLVALWSRVRHQMTISFEPHEEGTDVTIDTQIEAYEMNATRRWHECRSKGRLEESLFSAIEKRLTP